MGKIIDCHRVNPTTDCQHAVRGADEEEVLRKAGEHAKEHGLAPSPELLARAQVGFERVDGMPWTEIDFPEDVVRAEREVLPRIEAA